MRILHVTPYFTPAFAYGGVVRSVAGMAGALARLGHTVTVLTTDALAPGSRIAQPLDENLGGVRVIRVRNLLPRRANLSTPLGMWRVMRDLLPSIDVIHCHEFRTVENLLVTPLAARVGKPLLLSPHGTLALTTGRGRVKAAWDTLFSPAVARRFSGIIGLSAAEVEEAQALWAKFGNPPALFNAIPNGVDPADYAGLAGREAFRTHYGLGDGPICLFMARLHPRKGVKALVEAFRLANLADVRLVIAGPDEGALESIRSLLDERIIYTGYLDGAERLAAFAAADVFALPAVGEGLPMVVLEAMAAGLPAIVSPGCNLPEIAEYSAGLVVEPTIEALALALRMLLTDSARRSAMGEAATALVRARFTWDAVGVQLETLYTSLVQSSSD